jgi:hypothetical protein
MLEDYGQERPQSRPAAACLMAAARTPALAHRKYAAIRWTAAAALSAKALGVRPSDA